MDQEREDYADPEPRRRLRFSPGRITILVLLLFSAVILLLVYLIFLPIIIEGYD